jgi:PAS domain S-box-containing protein
MAMNRQRSTRSLDRSRWLFAALCVVAVLYTFAGAWLVTAGPADPVEHTAAFLAHLSSPWMVASYVVAGGFLVFGTWYLSRTPPHVDRDIRAVVRQSAVRLVLVLLTVAAALSTIGWLYIRDVGNALLAERSRQLGLIARLNAQHIGKWLVAKSIDSEKLATSLSRLPLDRLPGDADLKHGIELLFAESLAGNPERVAITLFAPDGAVLAHVGEGTAPDGPIAAAARTLGASPSSAPRIVDLYDEGSPAHPLMAFLAAVARIGAPQPAAILAIAVDPFPGLLDQLQALPGAGTASAVLVLRRDEESVIFITPPRLTPKPQPNSYRVPLAADATPAVQAMLRGDGVYRGRDTGGVEVLGAARRVNGVPWTVLAETGEADLTAVLQRREGTLALVIGAAVILAAIMLLVLWNGEYAALQAQEALAVSERAAMSQHFAQLTRLARDIVLMINPAGRIIEANEAAIAAYGYSEPELYSLTVADLRTPEELAKFEQHWRAGEARNGVLIETVHRRKDGSSFPVEISGRVIEVDGRPYRQAFIRDISARRKLEREVERLSRVRSALQTGTSVLLRAGVEHGLYQRVCEVMVRLGAYRAAYVGVPLDDAGRTVRFVAAAGVEHGYLDRAGITWSDDARGQGPTGAALRTGQIQVDQHLATSPALAPWRDEALERGAHACIGLPLKSAGRTIAALTVHAEQPEAFDANEVTLLAALADDMAFAVERLRAATPPKSQPTAGR